MYNVIASRELMHDGIADGSYFAVGAEGRRFESCPHAFMCGVAQVGSASYGLLSILSVSTLKTENKRH